MVGSVKQSKNLLRSDKLSNCESNEMTDFKKQPCIGKNNVKTHVVDDIEYSVNDNRLFVEVNEVVAGAQFELIMVDVSCEAGAQYCQTLRKHIDKASRLKSLPVQAIQ